MTHVSIEFEKDVVMSGQLRCFSLLLVGYRVVGFEAWVLRA